MIYLCGNAEYLKIGHSNAPRARCRSLQCGVPFEITLFYVGVPLSLDPPYRSLGFASWECEQRIHRDMRDFRIRGEWFSCTPEQVVSAVDYVTWKETS